VIRLTEFLFGMLPLDPSGRRAVDETLADWRHEADAARTMAGRVRTACAGAVSVVSVVSRVTLFAVARPATSWLCAAALLLGITLSLAMIEVTVFPTVARPVPPALALELRLLLLPMALAVCLPLAVLTPPFIGRHLGSAAPVCLLLMLASVGNLGWLLPDANQAFRQRVVGHHNPAQAGFDQPTSLPRGYNELSVAALLDRSRWSGDADAQKALNSRAVLLLMLPVCLLVGHQARRLAHMRSWRLAGLVIAWGTTAMGWATAYPMAGIVREILALPAAFDGYAVWLMPTVCLAAATLFSALAGRINPSTDSARVVTP
jgi:hypothetical protein